MELSQAIFLIAKAAAPFFVKNSLDKWPEK